MITKNSLHSYIIFNILFHTYDFQRIIISSEQSNLQLNKQNYPQHSRHPSIIGQIDSIYDYRLNPTKKNLYGSKRPSLAK